jgi:hypothetical protein
MAGKIVIEMEAGKGFTPAQGGETSKLNNMLSFHPIIPAHPGGKQCPGSL